MYKDLKRMLAGHIASAKKSVLIVAPYIKRPTLDALIAECAEGVDLTIVTVWELSDLAAGVSDLEVWETVCRTRDARLFLCPSLHAKYYRADDLVLIGSANITASALGFSKSPNLEILVKLSRSDTSLLEFESEMFSRCIEVTAELHKVYSDHLSQLSCDDTDQLPTDPCKDFLKEYHAWTPSTRYPENLFRYYCGAIEELTAAAKLTCSDDLSALKVPEGLTEDQFNYCLRTRLEAHPVFVELLEFGKSSKRFGEVRNLLSSMGALDGSKAWQIWMRWLKKFTPGRFEFWEASYSEIYKTLERPDLRKRL